MWDFSFLFDIIPWVGMMEPKVGRERERVCDMGMFAERLRLFLE